MMARLSPGRDESFVAIDHVAVAVAVGGCAEFYLLAVDGFDERVCVDQVGIWVSAIEVGAGVAVLGATRGEAELGVEDGFTVGSCDAGEAVEEDLEVWLGFEEGFYKVKVENVLQHLNVVGCAINDLNV